MKEFLIAGNWKMYKTSAEAKAFAEELKAMNLPNADSMAVMAPFTQLETLVEAFKDTGIKVGAQNVHYEKEGAFTGEISVDMLKEIGVDYCVVGHSERRQYFGETDETVNKKLKALLAADITPILCVGETLKQREDGMPQIVIGAQLTSDLAGLSEEDVRKIVIAYEPIWAIGTGKTATPEQAEDMCGFIAGMIEGIYGEVCMDRMKVLYGGSMKPANAKDLLSQPSIKGGLIGGASLKPESFAEIAKAAYELSE